MKDIEIIKGWFSILGHQPLNNRIISFLDELDSDELKILILQCKQDEADYSNYFIEEVEDLISKNENKWFQIKGEDRTRLLSFYRVMGKGFINPERYIKYIEHLLEVKVKKKERLITIFYILATALLTGLSTKIVELIL